MKCLYLLIRNSCGDFIVNVRETQKTGCPETATSSGNGNTNNTSGSPSTTNASASTYATGIVYHIRTHF